MGLDERRGGREVAAQHERGGTGALGRRCQRFERGIGTQEDDSVAMRQGREREQQQLDLAVLAR